MDVQIHIENGNRIFSSGDLLKGKIQILCTQTTTLSKLTTYLVGESTSSLTGAPGLLFSRREQEKHIIVQETLNIIPNGCASKLENSELVRLVVGCHRFDFSLRVPWVQDCSSYPSNPLLEIRGGDLKRSTEFPAQRIPPSTKDLQKGTEIAYRVDVSVTTIRNMFKSRTMKSYPVTIWPRETHLYHRESKSRSSTAIATARATVLGLSSLPLPSDISSNEIHHLVPAEIFISAQFQPDFQFTKGPRYASPSASHREISLELSVTKLNHHTQDLYLQSFQMLLVGYTDIHAGAASHGQMTFWTLQSLSNIGLRVFEGSDAQETQHKIDPKLWEDVKLDDSVVPEFVTCNLERRYELEVLMGWQCRSSDHAGRVFFVQVRTPVRISSGILSGRQLEKISPFMSKNDMQPVSSCCEARGLSGEALLGSHNEFYAPPSYDEAVRSAATNGPGI